MPKNQKEAKFGAKPAPKKTVKIAEHKFDDGHPLAWRFAQTDKGGPFPWLIEPPEKFQEVIEKLSTFEDKNWNEITRGGSHPIDTAALCNEAKERLVALEKDDLDELLSLRLAGDNRVWCVKNGHILRPLWWDADHKVYPVLKDKADRKKKRRQAGK